MRGVLPLLLIALGACSSGAQITRGDGFSTAHIAALAAGDGLRIAVAPVLDKTGADGEPGLFLVGDRYRIDSADGIPVAVRDMLVTELFAVPGLVVVDRELLSTVRAEQLMAQADDAGAELGGLLEGADLLLVAALTAFEPDAGGGALPLPIPVGGRGDFGLLRLAMRKGLVAMDLRVVDVRSGRVLNSIAVEGKASRFAMDFDLFLDAGHRDVKLPGVLGYFHNTPMEDALQAMTIKAVAGLAKAVADADNSPPVQR